MPRYSKKSAYRPRVVRRLKGAGNRKPACPTARFTLNKSYWVTPDVGGVAPQNASVLQINASTPFQPITVINGLWVANDTNNEPFGLAADMYSQYRHVVVKGSHVQVNIMDSPDNIATGSNTLLEGTASLTRTSDTGVVDQSTECKTLREYYGTKMRDFTMGDLGQSLKKSATLHAGYSPKRQWHAPALYNEDLKVVNQSGSNNTPTDSTFIMLSIRPSDDKVAGKNLKPFKVQIRITYYVTFIEPSADQNIPMPQRPPMFTRPGFAWSTFPGGLAAAYTAYRAAKRRHATPFGRAGLAWQGYRR